MNRSGYMIAPQAAIEILPNEHGDVTLRQGSSVITISANNLETLVEILVDIQGFAPPQPPDIDPLLEMDDEDVESAEEPPTCSTGNSSHCSREPTAPLTNAERQARYRARHRNGNSNGNSNGGDSPR